MSGDFLTPAFIGFVFRDPLRFLAPLGWPDRGALLERAWEEQFAALIDPAKVTGDGLRCVGSLACPFMTLRPTPENWLPLLVLNGTSVGNGQRIVTTVLDGDYQPRAGSACPLAPRAAPPCPLFSRTFMFHDLLQGSAPVRLDDVRLSTGAHNSARFPLLSPPGAIRDSGNRVVDRIVEGGYFEDFGAQTAAELAVAMRAVEPDLAPFVVVLSNNPEGREDARAGGPPRRRGFGREGSFMSDISAPLKAFAHARDARGLLAVDGIGAALDPGQPEACNVASIGVWGEPERGVRLRVRQLSMSWWLSKPVQLYLHEQTEYAADGRPKNNHGNTDAIRTLLAALGGAGPARPTPGCRS